MTFGEQNTEKEAHEMLGYAFDNGINILDTAEAVSIIIWKFENIWFIGKFCCVLTCIFLVTVEFESNIEGRDENGQNFKKIKK